MAQTLIGVSGQRCGMYDAPPQMRHLVSDTFVTEYGRAVAAADGLPVLLTRDAEVEGLVARLEGVLLAGGADVDPRRYGGVPSASSTVLDPGRDEFETALVLAAIEARLPLLGVCRGAQLINVALGGTLLADLATGEGESHAFLGYPVAHRSHAVTTEPGSIARSLLGRNARVNSYHHQAADALGQGLVATAHAHDGVVEAVEVPSRDVLGVQWHPEMLEHPDGVFTWLVGRARAAREGSNRNKELDDAFS